MSIISLLKTTALAPGINSTPDKVITPSLYVSPKKLSTLLSNESSSWINPFFIEFIIPIESIK